MRLIDADVLEYVKFHSVTDWTPTEGTSYQRGWNGAIGAIMRNAPTVDAVEVVRCKDCKFINECLLYWSTGDKNGYCVLGERKEDEID